MHQSSAPSLYMRINFVRNRVNQYRGRGEVGSDVRREGFRRGGVGLRLRRLFSSVVCEGSVGLARAAQEIPCPRS